MALQIRTTGVEDYIDGSANLKMLVIGPVGQGKTRAASFWPKPFFADCEGGRGSLSDRGVPYANVKNSQDMLEYLEYAKSYERLPKKDRPFQTLVIDTLDGFQRRVINEYMENTKAGTFAGWDAWRYLDSKMQLVLTRVFNLDYNVVVNAHYKDKVVKDGENETRYTELHLKGDVKDSAFYEFDLVGWLGKYYEADDGEKVEKRGLTFKSSPHRPFLKDRFGVMPSWIPIEFSEDDYGRLLEAFLSRVDTLPESQVVGEIPSLTPEEQRPSKNVVEPTGGPLPPQDPRDVPLSSYDKPTLVKMAKTAGITKTVDGQPIRNNTVKAELVAAIEKHRSEQKESDSAPASQEQPDPTPPAVPEQPQATDDKAAGEPAAEPAEQPQAQEESAPVEDELDKAADLVATELGAVDSGTGEVVDEPEPPVVSESPAAEEPVAKDVCEMDDCDVDLAGEVQDYIQLSKIRFRGKRYCNKHFYEETAKLKK